MFCCLCVFFCFKQKTAYEMRISDWSSDVCSSDLLAVRLVGDDEAEARGLAAHRVLLHATERKAQEVELAARGGEEEVALIAARIDRTVQPCPRRTQLPLNIRAGRQPGGADVARGRPQVADFAPTVAAHSRARPLAAPCAVGARN